MKHRCFQLFTLSIWPVCANKTAITARTTITVWPKTNDDDNEREKNTHKHTHSTSQKIKSRNKNEEENRNDMPFSLERNERQRRIEAIAIVSFGMQ